MTTRIQPTNNIWDRLSGTYRLEGRGKALLHGYLHIKIINGKDLRNLDCNCILAPSCITNDVSDPYVAVYAGRHRLAKTSIKYDNLNPVWNEDFFVPVAHFVEGLLFAVRDKDFNLYAETIGETFLDVEELLKFDQDGKQLRVGVHKVVFLDKKVHHGSLEYFVDYVPLESMGEFPMEVPGVYFKQNSGNLVKLYVNADDGGPDLPQVRYGGTSDREKVWQPPRLWRDIYDALCEAKQLIYVAGWSVDPGQSLLRGDEKQEALDEGKYSPYIGELLKQKADEGIRVDMMVWDDATSNAANLEGVMGTHDELARRYFLKTKVNFHLTPMVGDKGNAFHEKAGKYVMFTHHQKLVVVDSSSVEDSKKRELLAFVGGIDLTNGRWDNQKHPLFRSLSKEHKDDLYNGCFNVNAGGPRQPWHDIHSSVRGPAVLDIVQNFTERWDRQVPGASEELLDLEEAGLAHPPVYTGDNAWCSQLFRSIDSRTAMFDEKHLSAFESLSVDDMDEVCFVSKLQKAGNFRKLKKFLSLKGRNAVERGFATADGSTFQFHRDLHLKKGRNIDASVHTGMLYHIRRAEHTIYIESQYFLSSSHMWQKSSKTKCGNLIAAELTLKICQKIEAGERFAAYILIPMWSEGIADSAAVQAILDFQFLTIESMYKRIAAALKRRDALEKKAGMKPSTAHPRDYLNFYCLANRETKEEDASETAPKPDTAEELLARTRRHQVYVHSKMVIVDDAVALIGSANINQRSLDGARDSEIVLGSWQPAHMATKESIPRGDVHGFRLHCWATTMGRIEEVFRDPSSLNCVHRVNEIAEENWKLFSGNEVVEMNSHLVPYPILVGKDGTIKGRTQNGCFPDTKAKITGAKSSILPEFLTT